MDKYKLNEDVETGFHIILSIIDDRTKSEEPERYQNAIEIRNTLMLERLMFEMTGDYTRMKITKSFLQTIVDKCNKAIQKLNTKDDNTENVNPKDDNTKPTEEDEDEHI